MEIEDYEITHKLEDWFVMLNTEDFNGTDAEIVRDEIKNMILVRYGKRLGTTFINKASLGGKDES